VGFGTKDSRSAYQQALALRYSDRRYRVQIDCCNYTAP
jgi:hypothetical protein